VPPFPRNRNACPVRWPPALVLSTPSVPWHHPAHFRAAQRFARTTPHSDPWARSGGHGVSRCGLRGHGSRPGAWWPPASAPSPLRAVEIATLRTTSEPWRLPGTWWQPVPVPSTPGAVVPTRTERPRAVDLAQAEHHFGPWPHGRYVVAASARAERHLGAPSRVGKAFHTAPPRSRGSHTHAAFPRGPGVRLRCTPSRSRGGAHPMRAVAASARAEHLRGAVRVPALSATSEPWRPSARSTSARPEVSARAKHYYRSHGACPGWARRFAAPPGAVVTARALGGRPRPRRAPSRHRHSCPLRGAGASGERPSGLDVGRVDVNMWWCDGSL